MKLVMVGFMGAGKSTLGRLAGEQLGWDVADSDKVLAERLGEPIEEFFAREGEAAFRDREASSWSRLAPFSLALSISACSAGPHFDAA